MSGPWVIQCVRLEGRTFNPGDDTSGLLLKEYDPEYRGGRGAAVWTPELGEAMTFADPAEAWELWRTQSKTMPTRPDGRPNRPLTAYTIEVRQARELA